MARGKAIECDVVYQDVENENGRMVAGVGVSCSKCNHTVEAYGTSERSVRRCFMLLKEQCPNNEQNYYVQADTAKLHETPIQVISPATYPGLGNLHEYSIPRLIRENKFAVLKTETTGLKVDEDQVVQLGIIQVDYGQPRWRHTINVKPTCEVSPRAAEIHGFTAERLSFSPTLPEIANQVLAKLEGRIILGHNAIAYGWAMLRRELLAGGIQDMTEPVVLDTMHLERKIAKDHPELARKPGVVGHTLGKAHERWELPFEVKHSAIDDARIVWALFLRLCEVYPALGQASLADAIEIQNAEITLHALGARTRR